MLNDGSDLQRVNGGLVGKNMELRRRFVIAEGLILEANRVAKDWEEELGTFKETVRSIVRSGVNVMEQLERVL